MIRPRASATSSDVARHYDELDEIYRRLWGEHLHHGLFRGRDDEPQKAAERLVALVAERAGIGPGEHVCDVGCGYGATARALARSHQAEVTGITLSEAQLRWARRTAAPPGARLTFSRTDWLANDFADGSFDVVLALESLAHMADRRRFFQEARRTLRPGGRLVVCAWLASHETRPASRRLLLEPICRDGELASLGTEAGDRELLEAAGLRLDSFLDLTESVRHTWSVAIRRMTRAVLTDGDLLRLLARREFRSRRFARAVVRIWLAYRLGVLRYGLFAARRP